MELFRWTRRNSILTTYEPNHVIPKFWIMVEILKIIIPKKELSPITENNIIALTCESIFSGNGCRLKIDYNGRNGYVEKVFEYSWDKVEKLCYQVLIATLK